MKGPNSIARLLLLLACVSLKSVLAVPPVGAGGGDLYGELDKLTADLTIRGTDLERMLDGELARLQKRRTPQTSLSIPKEFDDVLKAIPKDKGILAEGRIVVSKLRDAIAKSTPGKSGLGMPEAELLQLTMLARLQNERELRKEKNLPADDEAVKKSVAAGELANLVAELKAKGTADNAPLTLSLAITKALEKLGITPGNGTSFTLNDLQEAKKAIQKTDFRFPFDFPTFVDFTANLRSTALRTNPGGIERALASDFLRDTTTRINPSFVPPAISDLLPGQAAPVPGSAHGGGRLGGGPGGGNGGGNDNDGGQPGGMNGAGPHNNNNNGGGGKLPNGGGFNDGSGLFSQNPGNIIIPDGQSFEITGDPPDVQQVTQSQVDNRVGIRKFASTLTRYLVETPQGFCNGMFIEPKETCTDAKGNVDPDKVVFLNYTWATHCSNGQKPEWLKIENFGYVDGESITVVNQRDQASPTRADKMDATMLKIRRRCGNPVQAEQVAEVKPAKLCDPQMVHTAVVQAKLGRYPVAYTNSRNKSMIQVCNLYSLARRNTMGLNCKDDVSRHNQLGLIEPGDSGGPIFLDPLDLYADAPLPPSGVDLSQRFCMAASTSFKWTPTHLKGVGGVTGTNALSFYHRNSVNPAMPDPIDPTPVASTGNPHARRDGTRDVLLTRPNHARAF